MATNTDFKDYCLEQLANAGNVTAKKMFGEYGIYLNGKIVGLLCDNQLFIKKTEKGAEILGEYEDGIPYKGAKPQFLISDLEDRDLLATLLKETYLSLPESVKKTQKNPAKKKMKK